MERSDLQKTVAWILGVSVMISGLVCGASSAYAADKVVVVPMGKSGPLASVAKTGQTTSYAAGDDGDLEKGVGMDSGRFVDNNNGTVTDKQTGLIWLKDGQCTAFYSADKTGTNNRPWWAAVDSANKLAGGFCGLTDGSIAGDWRLPNVNELSSLIDHSRQSPALPENCPLAGSTNVSEYYWSSTTDVGYDSFALGVYFVDGSFYSYDKLYGDWYVRCVRGGQ
jgi:hypothetical protein